MAVLAKASAGGGIDATTRDYLCMFKPCHSTSSRTGCWWI